MTDVDAVGGGSGLVSPAAWLGVGVAECTWSICESPAVVSSTCEVAGGAPGGRDGSWLVTTSGPFLAVSFARSSVIATGCVDGPGASSRWWISSLDSVVPIEGSSTDCLIFSIRSLVTAESSRKVNLGLKSHLIPLRVQALQVGLCSSTAID